MKRGCGLRVKLTNQSSPRESKVKACKAPIVLSPLIKVLPLSEKAFHVPSFIRTRMGSVEERLFNIQRLRSWSNLTLSTRV